MDAQDGGQVPGRAGRRGQVRARTGRLVSGWETAQNGGFAGQVAGWGQAEPDLGDVVIVLLVGTLAGLRDRLATDGFERAAEVVSDLVELADDYVTQVVAS